MYQLSFLIVVMAVNVAVIRALTLPSRSLTALLAGVLALIWSAALLLPITTPIRMNISAPLLGLSAAIAAWCVLYAYISTLPSGQRVLPGWAVVLALLGCGHLAIATGEHYRFVWGGGEVGIVNLDFFDEVKIECSGMVLIRIDVNTAHYRCPTGLAFGGLNTYEPFVPWPDYVAGESHALRSAILHMRAKAIRYQEE